MFPAQKRFNTPGKNAEEEIHNFQSFNDFKRDLDSSFKQRNFRPSSVRYGRTASPKEYTVNKTDIFRRIKDRLTRLNPKMKVEDFVNEEDKKYLLGKSSLNTSVRNESHDNECSANQSFSYSRTASRVNKSSSGIATPSREQNNSRDPSPIPKPNSAYARLKQTVESPIAARSIKTAQAYIKFSGKDRSFENAHALLESGNSNVLNKSLQEATPKKGASKERLQSNNARSEPDNALTPVHRPSILRNRPLINTDLSIDAAPKPNLSNRSYVSHSHSPGSRKPPLLASLPVQYRNMSTATKFDMLYTAFKNPSTRPNNSSTPKENSQPTRNITIPPIHKSFGSSNIRAGRYTPVNPDKLLTIHESPTVFPSKKSTMPLETDEEEKDKATPSGKKKGNVSFERSRNDLDSENEEEDNKPLRMKQLERPMDSIKRKFERDVRLELNKRVNLNSKTMGVKIDRIFDKLQRSFDYLEMRTYKVKPRKYDFEDYLKTLYGKDVTMKDYIVTQIKNNVTLKQQDQELIELAEFLKAQNAAMGEPASQL